MHNNLTKTLDRDIFILLEEQAVETYNFLLSIRRFAAINDLQKDVERIDILLAGSIEVLSLVQMQLSELRATAGYKRIGFFDTVKNVA